MVFNAGSEKSAAQLDSLTEDVLRCDAAIISLTAARVSFFIADVLYTGQKQHTNPHRQGSRRDETRAVHSVP